MKKLNDYVTKLMEDKNILFIYDLSAKTFNSSVDYEKYIIVTTDRWFLRNENPAIIDNAIYEFYTSKQWFELFDNCSILAYQCCSLSKTYKLKEYIRLLVATDTIKLHKQVNDSVIKNYEKYQSTDKKLLKIDYLFNTIQNTYFGIQILDNHKIVNFKNIGSKLTDIYNLIDTEDFLIKYPEYYQSQLLEFNKRTNGIIMNYKIKNGLANRSTDNDSL